MAQLNHADAMEILELDETDLIVLPENQNNYNNIDELENKSPTQKTKRKYVRRKQLNDPDQSAIVNAVLESDVENLKEVSTIIYFLKYK